MESKLLLQMAEALTGGRVLYLSVPITTGRRELRLLSELGIDNVTFRQPPHRERWNELVVEANKREAWVYAEVARARFPKTVVVDPSSLDLPGWGQDEYNSFWAEIIAEHACAVVAAPGWAFSKGARLEIDLAVHLRLPIISLDGGCMERADIVAADNAARESIEELPGADDYLVPMRWVHGGPANPSYADSPDVRAVGEVVGWLRGERRYQLKKFGIQTDDRHTAHGLGDESWWWRQLTTYLHRGAIRLGIETQGGRQALAKFAATACGLAESLLRCHGPFWPDGPDAEDCFAALRPGRESDALFRWLVAQRAETLGSDVNRRDDAWIDAGVGEDSAWWHENMMNLRSAQQFPTKSLEGRLAVAHLLLRACALCEAIVRRHGPLPPPGVPSGYQLGAGSPS